MDELNDQAYAEATIRELAACNNIIASFDFHKVVKLETLAKKHRTIRTRLTAALQIRDAADHYYLPFLIGTLIRVGAEGAFPALVGVMQDTSRNNSDRFNAGSALGRFGKRAMPVLRQALASTEPDIRACAASSLAHLHEATAVKLLLKVLADEDREVRDSAKYSLRQFPATLARPYLQAALTNLNPFVRAGAADACLTLRIDRAQAERTLLELLKHSHVEVRAAAAVGLGTEDRHLTKHAVSPLCGALNDPDRRVRYWSVRALSELKNEASRAVPELLRLMQTDSDEGVRTEAAIALGQTGLHQEGVILALIDAARGKDIPSAAIVALGNMGPAARTAIPELEKLRKKWRQMGHEDHVLKALAKIRGEKN